MEIVGQLQKQFVDFSTSLYHEVSFSPLFFLIFLLFSRKNKRINIRRFANDCLFFQSCLQEKIEILEQISKGLFEFYQSNTLFLILGCGKIGVLG